jgi:hypothetical protein
MNEPSEQKTPAEEVTTDQKLNFFQEKLNQSEEILKLKDNEIEELRKKLTESSQQNKLNVTKISGIAQKRKELAENYIRIADELRQELKSNAVKLRQLGLPAGTEPEISLLLTEKHDLELDRQKEIHQEQVNTSEKNITLLAMQLEEAKNELEEKEKIIHALNDELSELEEANRNRDGHLNKELAAQVAILSESLNKLQLARETEAELFTGLRQNFEAEIQVLNRNLENKQKIIQYLNLDLSDRDENLIKLESEKDRLITEYNNKCRELERRVQILAVSLNESQNNTEAFNLFHFQKENEINLLRSEKARLEAGITNIRIEMENALEEKEKVIYQLFLDLTDQKEKLSSLKTEESEKQLPDHPKTRQNPGLRNNKVEETEINLLKTEKANLEKTVKSLHEEINRVSKELQKELEDKEQVIRELNQELTESEELEKDNSFYLKNSDKTEISSESKKSNRLS